jgi:hypothetical protein
VNAEQLRRSLQAHSFGDHCISIAALRHEFRVPEALHQHDPGKRDVGYLPPGVVGLPEYLSPGIEGITRANASHARPAVCCGICERIDDLQLLNDQKRSCDLANPARDF